MLTKHLTNDNFMLCHLITLFVRWSTPPALRHLQASTKRSHSLTENLEAITDDGRSTVTVFVHYLLSLAEIFFPSFQYPSMFSFILPCCHLFPLLLFFCPSWRHVQYSHKITARELNSGTVDSTSPISKMIHFLCVASQLWLYWRTNNKLERIRKKTVLA
jgi:hypothetical protein